VSAAAERWRRVRALLADALELPESARADFLARSCPEPELRREVEELLDAVGAADGFFGGLAARAGLAEAGGEPPEMVGRRVGAWRLVGFLGRGGMGSVWRAERADGQFEKTAALKLLALGAASPEARRRFLAEREILARLEHPNVARLYDGGVADDGTPYFVMELVDGLPIDAWCDARELGVEPRIRLFLDVCDAVAFAHARGIVHRDLKPPNVLVTADGRVRLLDFGIAKLLRPEAGLAPADTATGVLPMTPAYASPEQLLGERVTEATDVYSLGVVLHELLTGLSPWDRTTGDGLAAVRAVCEEARTDPSTRLRGAPPGAGVEALARARGTSLPALVRRLRGDLDTIVRTAIAREPGRRYASVDALAEDLRRHLADQPVRARPDTLAYRASRFFARHAVGAAAIAAILVLGVALLGVAVWSAEERSSQSQRLGDADERTAALLAQLVGIYESVDPSGARGSSAVSRELLDAAVAGLDAVGELDPESRATLRFAAGRVYRRLGAWADARPLLTEALALRAERIAAPDERLAEVLFELGACLARSGRAAEGVERLREALAMARELHGDDHLHVAQVRFELASAWHDAGGGDAEAEFREAVRVFRAHAAEPTVEHANALMALGDYVAVRGDVEGALALYEEALGIHEALYGPDHPFVALALNGIGMLRYNLGEKDEARELLARAADVDRAAYGDAGHPDLAMVLTNLGNVLSAEGDPAGVEALEEAAAVHRALPESPATSRGFTLASLGGARGRLDDSAGAIAAYEEALAAYEAGGVPAMFRSQTRTELARLLLAQGPSERAVELLAAVVAGYAALLPADHPRVVAAREELEAARAR